MRLEKIQKGEPTRRMLTLQIEVIVEAGGPSIKRGVTTDDLVTEFGEPAVRMVEKLVPEVLGADLRVSKSNVIASWEYNWLRGEKTFDAPA